MGTKAVPHLMQNTAQIDYERDRGLGSYGAPQLRGVAHSLPRIPSSIPSGAHAGVGPLQLSPEQPFSAVDKD